MWKEGLKDVTMPWTVRSEGCSFQHALFLEQFDLEGSAMDVPGTVSQLVASQGQNQRVVEEILKTLEHH